MPFTLAHPAAVLPLIRRPLDGLALVCGAFAPDIPYFIRSTPLVVTAHSWYEPFANATTSHSVAGLPVTLVLASAMYLLLRAAARPSVWLLQGRWDTADPSTDGAAGPADGTALRRTARSAWVPVSLLVGALTHLLWDSFADSGGPLAEHFDAVNETALGDVTWIRLSQHASTVFGLAVLAYVLWRRRSALVSDDAVVRRRAFWILVSFVVVGSVAAVLAVLTRFDPSAALSTGDGVEGLLSTAAKGAGVAVGVIVVVATAGWWLSLLRIRHQAAPVTVK